MTGKFRLTLACALMAVAGVSAAASLRAICFYKTDGTKFTMAIESEDMATSVADGEVRLTCSKGEIVMPSSEVNRWVYLDEDAPEGPWTGITAVKGGSPEISLADGVVMLSGVADGSPVTLTDMSGRTVRSLRASGDCVVPLSGLQPGVYVLTCNSHSVKISVAR